MGKIVLYHGTFDKIITPMKAYHGLHDLELDLAVKKVGKGG